MLWSHVTAVYRKCCVHCVNLQTKTTRNLSLRLGTQRALKLTQSFDSAKSVITRHAIWTVISLQFTRIKNQQRILLGVVMLFVVSETDGTSARRRRYFCVVCCVVGDDKRDESRSDDARCHATLDSQTGLRFAPA